MSHEIEADFKEEYTNEELQCRLCNSYKEKQGKYICSELEIEVPENGHCDFFKSRD